MRDSKMRLARGAAAAALAICLSGTALAQGAPPTPAPAAATPDNTGLADIVVTANKRSESIQNVPSSVLALTAVALERANVRDFDDLTKIAPTLTISKTSQPGNNSINIRGIGTYSFSISTQPSVAVVIDDIPQSFQAAAFTALTDVSQIEVLRGPQSTLFGKAASAGVVNITTQAPTDHFTGRADILATNDDEQRFQGSISGPITQNLKFRLTGNYSRYRGNIFNETTGHWLNGQSDLTFRGKLVWDADPDTQVTLSPYYTRTRSHCCAPAEYFVSPGVTFSKGNIPQSAILGDIVPSPQNRKTRLDVDAKAYSNDWGTGLKIAHTFGNGLTIANIASYDRYHLDDLQDTDSSDFNFQTLNPALPVGGSANGGFFTVKSVTEEVRLTSPSHSAIRWVGGFFFSNTQSKRDFTRGSNTLGTFNGIASLPSTNNIAYSYYDSQSAQSTYALYGQATYDITPKLSVTGGLRAHREDISYNFTDFGNNITYGIPGCSTVSPTASLKINTCNTDNVVLGRAAIQYHVTPAFMVFANYARGYKGLAYDLTSSLTIRTPLTTGALKGVPTADGITARQPVAPETSNAMELGFKGTFFDRRVTWNVTGFYQEYFGFQASSRDEVTGQNILNSVGKVTTKGVESEITTRFTPDVMINLNAAYDIAKINRFPNAGCFSQQTVAEGCVGGVQDLSGKGLPNAPKWNFSVNGEYDHHLSDKVMLIFAGDMHYQSSVFFSLLQDPDSYQKGYAIADLSLALKVHNYKFTFFVNNVTDQNYVLTKGRDVIFNTSHSVVPVTNAIAFKPARDADRYFGGRFSVTF